MPDNEIIRTYDASMRRRVRKTLATYKNDNRIGVPKLRTLINESDPLGREIDISTLQRFLKGQHQTVDMSVSICHEFLRAHDIELLPEQDEAIFGPALSQFHVPPTTMPEPITKELRESLSGDYREVMTEQQRQEDAHLCLSIRPYDDERFMLARARTMLGDDLAMHEEEGVLIALDNLFYVTLRCTKTGRPRTLYLEEMRSADPGKRYLKGQFINEPGFRIYDDPKSTISQSQPVLLVSEGETQC